MYLLVAGLILWTTVHLFPSRAVAAREKAVAAVGLNAYKGIFSVLILSALALIVLGWRATPPTALWYPPTPLRHFAMLLMLPAVVMFVAARVPGNPIKVRLKHPQLMAVGTWALTHLLANGEMRSILLFGTLLIWSFVNIKSINARDGKPNPPLSPNPTRQLILTVGIGTLVWIALTFAHPHFTGRALVQL